MWIRGIARRVSEVEIWLMSLLLAASLVYVNFQPIYLIIGLVFWLLRWVAYGYLSRRTPTDWAILVLSLLVPVTLWVTAMPEVTLPQVYRLLCGIMIYYVIVNWASSEAKLRIGLIGLALTGLALSGYALISVDWSDPTRIGILEVIHQAFAPYLRDTVNPNVMAGSLVILLPLMIALVLADPKPLGWAVTLLAGITAAGMGVVLLLTLSRGAWLALFIAMLLLVMLRWRRGWIFVICATAIGLGVIFIIGIFPSTELLLAGTSAGSVETRLELWLRGIMMVKDFPLSGIGMGSFGYVLTRLYPFAAEGSDLISHAHNLFLQVSIDLGIPGLISWLAILFLVVVSAWRVYRWSLVKFGRKHWITNIAVGYLCSQTALIVHGWTDSVTWGMVKPAPIIWVVWGFAIMLENLMYQEINTT